MTGTLRRPHPDEIAALVKLDREHYNATQEAYGMANNIPLRRWVIDLEHGRSERIESYDVLHTLSLRFGLDLDELLFQSRNLTPLLFRLLYSRAGRTPEAIRVAHHALKEAGF